MLVAGLASDHRNWLLQSTYLKKKYRVVCVNVGSGENNNKHAELTIESMAKHLNVLLQELEIQRSIIVGFSMGGIVALEHASKNPEMVQGLVLTSMPTQDDTNLLAPFARDLAFAANTSCDVLRVMAPYFFSERFIHSERFEAMSTFGASNSEASRIELILSHLKAIQAWIREKMWEKTRVKCPGLAIYGSEDRLLCDKIEAALIPAANPNIVVKTIHSAGHCVHIEKPGEFNKLIGQFIERCLSSAGMNGAS